MNQTRLSGKSFFTVLSIWAVSLGCSVGWGAFVMPGTMFLPSAGPLGTVLAMLIGGGIMLVIAANFHNLMNRSSHTGGVFAYTREVFSYDHSLMCVWSIVLAYISILWANATAIPLISRFLFGGVFQFGFKYTVLGYDVYLGECLVTLAAIVLFGLLTARSMKITRILQSVLAIVLFGGVTVCFLIAFSKTGMSFLSFKPYFSDNGIRPVFQVMNIVGLTPWAFLGFCTVSLLPGKSEFSDGSFPRKKSFAIMAAAILAGMLIYIFLALLSTLSLPKGCGNWQEYVSKLSFYNGFAGIPTFYAAQKLLGNGGVVLLDLCVLAGILTGIIGMYRAGARLLLSLAEDDVLPKWFGKETKRGLPSNATHFIMFISFVIPFFGRTAIGWIVDVLSITAAIAYAYVSAASFKIARNENRLLYVVTGTVGVLASVFFFMSLIPNPLVVNSLATESYLVLLVWSVVGLVLFRFVFIRDKTNRFGHSTIMWIAMLTIVLLSSMMWMRQMMHIDTENTIQNITNFHQRVHVEQNIPMTAPQIFAEHKFMERQMDVIQNSQFVNSIFQFAVVIFSLFIMFNIFSTQQKREKRLAVEKGIAEQANKAKSAFLSNMSHDIRTPMNAIIGFTNLALKNPEDTERTSEYLAKIKASSDHLLSLINDVLEMSRIESGKVELDEQPCSLPEILHDLNTIIIGQVTAKQQELFMDAVNVTDENIICDKLRLNQILLNLLSNATKYTPIGGKISVRVVQKGREEGFGVYEIHVKDNGIGMSPKFASRVFEAFEREKTSTVSGIQGTGLGMAITKQLVELMGGTITVETKEGKGTDFIMSVKFKIQDGKLVDIHTGELKNMHALVVDDDFDTCDSVTRMLGEMDLRSEWTMSGKEAVLRAKQAAERGDSFDVFFVDWKLVDLNGIEVSRQIRSVVGDEIPIILMTAYDWPSIKDEAVQAGVSGFCNKPVFSSELHNTLLSVTKRVAEEVAPENGAGASDRNGEKAVFTGKRLLLVDDVEVNREIATMLLEIHGFTVEQAVNGYEALLMVSNAKPNYYDAVLMDIQMPKMNGYEAAREIRKLSEGRETVPIIAMTANAFDEDKKAALDAGMNAHVAKPIDENQLMTVLGEIIQK